MSVIDEPQVVDTAAPSERPDAEYRRRLRRRRQVLVSPIVLVALVLLVPALWGAVVGLRKVVEPEAFAGTGGIVAGFSGPAEPGERYSYGISNGKLPDVTMRSAKVLVTDGSAAAATTISICRWNPDQAENMGPIGGATGDLSESCTDLEPVDGRDLGNLGPKDNLVLTVVLLEEGVVRVTGFELSYEQDDRRGNERIEAEITVGAPA